MTFAIQQMLLRTLVVTALIVPGLEGLVQTGDLEDLQDSYRETRQTREKVVAEMRQLQDEYETVVDRIDELKNKGTAEIQNRMSVEQLLSRSQTIADRLERQQKRLTRLDKRLAVLRSKIVDEIDTLTTRIEQQLGEVPASEREKLVEQLNELREIRKQHNTPLPSAPDAGEIRETLEMASQLTSAHPDQMEAAAAELADTEDQVRERLTAVEKKLKKLQKARTLSRRARTFQSEEQFFDEESRPRVVGRHRDTSSGEERASADQGTNTSAGQETSGGTGVSDSEPKTSPTGETDQGADEPSPSAPEESFNGDRRSAGSAAPGGGSEASDKPAAAEQAPSEPSAGSDGAGSDSSGGGAFDSQDSVVLESDADPSTSVSSGFVSDSTLEDRIEKLERERDKLEKQADELQQTADTLRDRADEMKNLE